MEIRNATLASDTAKTQGALALVMALYFIWGFITSLNDILIPHLKSIFALNYGEAMLIQTFFFSAYFVFAIPAGHVVDFIGYKKTMVSGLIVLGVGALLFLPAASLPSFPMFLAALSVLAAGMTFLQVSANPYVSVLGPVRTASSRLNLAGAFNSLGTTIAPYLGGVFILSSVTLAGKQGLSPSALQAYRLEQVASIKLPYLLIAGAVFLFAVVMGRSKLPPLSTHDASLTEDAGVRKSIWQYRHLLLGVVGIFTYVGAEVSIGSFLVNYLSQPNIGNMPEKTAASYVACYWGSAMIGRTIGAAITRKLRSAGVLAAAALFALVLVATSMASSGHLAMWSIVLVGLFNSILWPNIFTLAIAGLGPLTNRGSSLLIAAIIGGAIVPLAQGLLADRVGIQHAFVLPLFCYAYIVFYGLRGYKQAEWVGASA